MDYQIPPEIDETKTDFSKIIKPANHFFKKIPWFVATFLAIVVIGLSWGNITGSDAIYKTVLPIILIYAVAAAFMPSMPKPSTEPVQQPSKIWYKTSLGHKGRKRIACTWQGWLVDLMTLVLVFANIIIAAIPFSRHLDFNSTAAPVPHQTTIFFISLFPTLLIIAANFWIRGKYSEKI